MKQHLINGRWNMWVPDHIANWDGMTGDPSIPSGWEWQRLQSMQENLRWGDVLFDIGTEHGALSAVIAREFVGPQHMVLCEPSPEFWPNIFKTWKYNGLAVPVGCWPGFVGAETSDGFEVSGLNLAWPPCAAGDEVDAMAYRSMATPGDIATITVDHLAEVCRVFPIALNIDVEGAELLVLQGAERWLADPYDDDERHVWVSVHEDLMAPFGHTPGDVAGLMDRNGWRCEYLATDHEAHWHWWK